jgi:hypothetical protein
MRRLDVVGVDRGFARAAGGQAARQLGIVERDARDEGTGLDPLGRDVGGAYTYLNPQAGNEFSATLGFTYNFENVHTQYQNGIDMHLDVAAAHFVSKEMFFGAVGYVYRQLTCDSGAGDRVGCFQSQVFGVGP